jgi:hypothetical protein
MPGEDFHLSVYARFQAHTSHPSGVLNSSLETQFVRMLRFRFRFLPLPFYVLALSFAVLR